MRFYFSCGIINVVRNSVRRVTSFRNKVIVVPCKFLSYRMAEADKLNIDSIIARLLEGNYFYFLIFFSVYYDVERNLVLYYLPNS